MLHHEVVDPGGRRLVRCCTPSAAAVVLGSTQQASDFDEKRVAAAGFRLVRRQSGGGAVLVAPGSQVWLDVFVPTGDPLAEHDVGRAFAWLGAVYGRALASELGETRATQVHAGAPARNAWSPVLCFAGLGPGEVTVDERKVVGMSQRRDRTGAWFQTLVALDQLGSMLADLLECTELEREEARALLKATGLSPSDQAAGLADRLTRAVLGALP